MMEASAEPLSCPGRFAYSTAFTPGRSIHFSRMTGPTECTMTILVTALLSVEVVTVALYVLPCDIAFAAIAVDSNKAYVLVGCMLRMFVQVLVVGGVVRKSDALLVETQMNSLSRRDQIRKLDSARSPALSECAFVASTVCACVGSLAVVESVFAKDGDTELFAVLCHFLAIAGKRKNMVVVLEQHSTFSGDLASEFTMGILALALDVDEFVDNTLGSVIASRVQQTNLIIGPRREVGATAIFLGRPLLLVVLTELIPSGDNSQLAIRPAEAVSRHTHIKASKSRCYTTSLSEPVTLHKALEAHFILENAIEQFAVLTSVTLVDLVVGTHDATNASLDALGEWPSVDFVQSSVVKVAADGVRSAPFPALAEVLLFVGDVMFCGGNDAFLLDTFDHRSGKQTFRQTTEWTHAGTKHNVNTLAISFPTMRTALEVDQFLVPGSSKGNASRESGDVVGESQTQGTCYPHTYPSPSQYQRKQYLPLVTDTRDRSFHSQAQSCRPRCLQHSIAHMREGSRVELVDRRRDGVARRRDGQAVVLSIVKRLTRRRSVRQLVALRHFQQVNVMACDNEWNE
ncbi:glycoside hydrolase family 3 protein, partial [Aureobasidium sp. EXF-3399]